MMRILAIILLVGVTSGCWYTQVTRGMVSTREVDFSKGHQVDRTRKVCAYDRKHIIWYFPTGIPSPQEAVDRALDRVKSSRRIIGLSDAKIKYRWFWLYFYGQVWYSAEGYPIYENSDSVSSKNVTTKEEKSDFTQMSREPIGQQDNQTQDRGMTRNGLHDFPF